MSLFRNWFKSNSPAYKPFANVELLLRGRRPRATSDPSLVLFTVHKSASAYLRLVLHNVAEQTGLASVDYEGYRQETPEAELRRRWGDDLVDVLFGHPSHPLRRPAEVQRRLRHGFPETGCFIGALRRPHVGEWLPHADRLRKLVVLRDPRDVLTSYYFSRAFSHQPPQAADRRARFEADRRQVRETAIDTWVLKEAHGWVQRYETYCRLIERPLVHCASYEMMVSDFEQWFDGVLAFWGLAVRPETRRQVLEKADFSVDRENIYSHKRQVQPGDHARKLQGATIEELNRRFAAVLDRLGYARDVTRRGAA